MDTWRFVLVALVVCSAPSGVLLEEVDDSTGCFLDDEGDFDCRNISLTTVPEDLPWNCSMLLLDYNNLSILRNDELLNKGAINFHTLHIRENNIEVLEDNAFNGLTNLRILTLGSNNLTVFSQDIISGIPQMQELFLDRNPLVMPSSDADPLVKSDSLSTLSLSMCNLTRLSSGLFSETRNLSRLYLTHNLFTTVHWNALSFLNLRTLDLEGNHLEHVPLSADMVQSLRELDNEHGVHSNVEPTSSSKIGDELTTIDLTSNPLRCDCHLSLARYAMKQRFSWLFGTCVQDSGAGLDIGVAEKMTYLLSCRTAFMDQYGAAA